MLEQITGVVDGDDSDSDDDVPFILIQSNQLAVLVRTTATATTTTISTSTISDTNTSIGWAWLPNLFVSYAVVSMICIMEYSQSIFVSLSMGSLGIVPMTKATK